MTEHTPGPWLKGLEGKIWNGTGEILLLQSYVPENDALLEAAPDLLEAAMLTERWIANIPGNLLAEIIDKEGEPPLDDLWAAIAKARGE